MRRWAPLAATLLLAACRSSPASTRAPLDVPDVPARVTTLSIVGTNDLHGRVHALPLLAGYVENLRAARREDGGAVLLLDGGDMFQGTLASNLLEGAPVRDAYAAMGYDAVAVGNHEFDYGPPGEAATPTSDADDPRGALRALAAGAPFPFLTANIVRAADGERVAWDNMPADVVVAAGSLSVGIIGVSTEDTLRATHSANVSDLAMAPLAETIERRARALRDDGAAAIVVVAHAGGACERFTGDFEADGCKSDEEIFEVARALPEGTVDVIVAGHTHAGVAHDVAGVAIIEQFSYGRAFGRVDLRFEGDRLVSREIFAPQALCDDPGDDLERCHPGEYAGAPVRRIEAVQAAIAGGLEAANAQRDALVGTTVLDAFERAHRQESALGNLFSDLLLDAVPGAEVAMVNGGGLRDDLPPGPLRYGDLFVAFPFDNRVAAATISVADLERLWVTHLQGEGGILSVAGLTVRARCGVGGLEVELRRDGERLPSDQMLTIVASDFMMAGGDDFWGGVSHGEVELRDALVRDALAEQLAQRPEWAPGDFLIAGAPRLRLPMPRPVRCPTGSSRSPARDVAPDSMVARRAGLFRPPAEDR